MSKIFRASTTIPAAIVLAGGLIAWSVFLSGGGGSVRVSANGGDSFGNRNSGAAVSIRPVDESDHVFGDPSASVAIVEFSDFECPFCRRLHPTLAQIVNDFEGEVKWVYRHFPLTQSHSRALQASLASECVAELGGNSAFWSFADQVFSNQSRLGNPLYEQIAGDLGIPLEEFNTCLDSRKHNSVVQEDFQDAINSGAIGTPFAVVINGGGETFPFSGALSYEQIRSIVEAALTS